MTLNQKAALLKRLQKLDHEMRLRHYPAVMETDRRDATGDRQYIERRTEAEFCEEVYGRDE